MPATATHCPRCNSLLPAGTTICPNCSRLQREFPTCNLNDLNSTTDFRSTELTLDPPEEIVGSQLGNYLIEQFLGQGGMARVYRAKHLTLERPCAIKILKTSSDENLEDAVSAFLSEARAAAALVHPHVVTIHSIGHDRDKHFIEMEFIEGNSLAALIDTEGPRDPADATRFMVQICSALALAHEHGMVHRDIKPANVLVTRDRIAKLADFGLAKRIHEPHGGEFGILTGTPSFMAPELFDGVQACKRTDIYAMGVTYFVLLTGQLPHSGESLGELMQSLRKTELPDVQQARAGIPDIAANVVRRCLAKQADSRFPDARTLLLELNAVYGSLRSLESMLHESLRGVEVTLQGERDSFEATIALAGGRRQKVTIEIRESAAVAQQVVRISSICGPADERHFLRALRLNPDFPYGALGVEMIGGKPHFVMTNVYPRATCDPEEIRHSVLGIAQHADDAERWLSADDVH